jgi:hypothetical protein
MESDTRVSEKCSDICAETAVIGFHSSNTLRPQNPFFFVRVLHFFPGVARSLSISTVRGLPQENAMCYKPIR